MVASRKLLSIPEGRLMLILIPWKPVVCCLVSAGSDAVGWIRWLFGFRRKERLCDDTAPFVSPSDAEHCR
jgi:hypothetical protein